MKTKQKHIRTEADFLPAFRAVYGGKGDGKRELATWIGVTHQAVCNWFMRPTDGREPIGIPSGYHAQLLLWAAHHGFVLHPAAFGLGSDGRPLVKAGARAA